MRTLTSTLLTAQRAFAQAPLARVVVRDKQARWSEVGFQANVAVGSAVTVNADGLIVTAALDGTGKVRVRVVDDPTYLDAVLGEGAGWGWWTSDWVQVASGALAWPTGDVALSCNASGVLRLFYVKSDGSAIYCRESSDGGATWGAEETVKAVTGGGATYNYRLASAGHEDVFWCFDRSGYRYVYYRKKATGSWGSEVSLVALTETGGEFITCGGLSALWDGTNFHLAAAFWGTLLDDGRIVTAAFDGTTTSAVARVVPPGVAALGFTPRWPSLLRTSSGLGSVWVLTYLDQFASSGSTWTYAVAILSRDGVHWSYKIPLGFYTTHARRMALAETGGVVYAHQVQQVYRLGLWSSGAYAFESTEAQSRLLSAEVDESPELGQMSLELDNSDGRYDDAGVTGSDVPCLRSLSTVALQLGHHTSVGDEWVTQREMLLWSVTRVRRPGSNWARLYCVDGFELFRRWRPDATYLFTSKSLSWCIAELAARVGNFLTAFDDRDEWDMLVNYLAVAGESTDWSGTHHIRAVGRWIPLHGPSLAFDERIDGWNLLQALLGLVGGACRWGSGTAGDTLYCFIPSKEGTDPAAAYTYSDGEILAGEYGDAFAWPTRVRVIGTGVTYEKQSYTSALAAGMEFFGLLNNANWTTAAQCEVAADAMLDDATARQKGGWIETLPNLGLELFDVIALTDSLAGAALTSVRRRVNGLVTRYEPGRARWLQRVKLERG